MGVEYKIGFLVEDAQSLDAMLRQAPFFSDYDENFKLYNYREDLSKDLFVMPDAHAAIEADGIYFCGNCGKISSVILEHLKRAASQRYGSTVVVEL